MIKIANTNVTKFTGLYKFVHCKLQYPIKVLLYIEVAPNLKTTSVYLYNEIILQT